MRKSLTTGCLLLFAASCVENGPAPLVVTATDLASPAGEGSGEPNLSSDGDAIRLSWLEPGAHGGHELRFSTLDGHGWSEPVTIAAGEGFFVNWADFPSLTASADGTLWAHWLQRGPAGGYDYGVRIVRSDDRGATWSEPWTPHDDDSPTEHGFVAPLVLDDGMGFAWLDGREHAEGPDGAPPTGEMTLRYRTAGPGETVGSEMLVDGRVCDCCQTDAATTASGAVLVYRDRSEDEIRDIYAARLVDGRWSEGAPVHEDGWRIEGCPVNGPAVAALGDEVFVAWFTGAGDVARVKAAFSSDGGATFGEPVVIDDGAPVGRVDVQALADRTALVTWLERTDGEAAEIRVRRIDASGGASPSVSLTGSSSERASGFPRTVVAPDGSVLLAWTDVSGPESRVRLRRLDLEG